MGRLDRDVVEREQQLHAAADGEAVAERDDRHGQRADLALEVEHVEAGEAGLVLTGIDEPAIQGFQWMIKMRPKETGEPTVPFPADSAGIGREPPPLLPPDAPSIGMDA